MDITFKTGNGIFNYRVCAVIIHNGKLLAMKNPRTPYYFLPGGRVRLHEEACDAVLREIREELNIAAKIVRPLWLNQGFFIEDVTKERFHEICLYFLMDISDTDLLSKGDTFIVTEGTQNNQFRWIPIKKLNSEYFYPNFIKDKVGELPDSLTILAEYE